MSVRSVGDLMSVLRTGVFLRLKRLVLAMASCLSSHPFTRGESYVLANAIPSHEEGHRSQMIHNVRHLIYGAGGKKASWQDRCKFLGN